MKLTAIFLLAACLNVSASGSAQKINLKEKSASLSRVFREIKKQSGYTFAYTRSLLEKARPVTISISNASIEQVLDICFQDQSLTYTIVNKTVVVLERKDSQLKKNTLPPPAAVPVPITGRITNSKGEPLEGVSVLVVGSRKGTTTNKDGRFELNVPAGNEVVLEFSFVGFQTKTMQVTNQTDLQITLEEAIAGLTNIVVVGYGTQKKITLTNAVSQIKGEDINRRPVGSTQQSLQGLASGLYVIDNGGRPGNNNVNIRIRGLTTLGDNNPLVIIDGVEQQMNSINPDDIESVSVLKDATSTAIYGSRAANGVILITTKRGKAGTFDINYHGYYALQQTTNRPEHMELENYFRLENAAFVNSGAAAPHSESFIREYVDATDRVKYPLPFPWFDKGR